MKIVSKIFKKKNCLKEQNSMFKAKEATHTISKRHQAEAVTQLNQWYDSTGKVSTSTHSTLPHTSHPLHLDSKEILAYQILIFRLILELRTLGYGSHIAKSWPPHSTRSNRLSVFKPLYPHSQSETTLNARIKCNRILYPPSDPKPVRDPIRNLNSLLQVSMYHLNLNSNFIEQILMKWLLFEQI